MTTFGDRFDNIFYDRQIYGRSLLRKKRSNCKLKTYASNTDCRTWSSNIYKRRSNILEVNNTFGDQCIGKLSWAAIFPLICGDAKSREEEENALLKSRLLQALKDLRQVQFPDCNICKKLYEEIECCRNGLPCCHLAAIERETKYAMCAFFEELYNVIYNCSEFKECFIDCKTRSGDATLGQDGLTNQSLFMNDSLQDGIYYNERELISLSNNNYYFTSTLNNENCADSRNQEKEEKDHVEKQQNCKPCEVDYSKLQAFTFNQTFSSDDQQRLVPRRLSPSQSMPSVFNLPAISTPRHSRPTSANSRRYQELSQTVKKIPSNGSDSTLYHLNCTEPLDLNSVSEEIQATVDHNQDHDKELHGLLGTSNSQECQPNNAYVDLSDYEKQVVANVSEKLNGIIEKMNQLTEKDCLSQKVISDLKCEIVSLREETKQQKRELKHTIKINEQQEKKYAMYAFFEELSKLIYNSREFKECFTVSRTWSGDAIFGPDGLTNSLFFNDSFHGGIESEERELISLSNNNYDFTSIIYNCTDSHNQEKEEHDNVQKQQNCIPCEVGFSKHKVSTFNQPLSSDDEQQLVPLRLSPSHSIPSVFNTTATSTPCHLLPSFENNGRCQEQSQTVKEISSNGSNSTLYNLHCTEPFDLNSDSKEIQAIVDNDMELHSFLGSLNSQQCQPNNAYVDLSDYEKQVISNVSEKLNGIIEKMHELSEKDCLSQKIISDMKCKIVSLQEDTKQQKCDLKHIIKINKQQEKKYAMYAFFEEFYKVIYNCNEFKECFIVCKTWSGDATFRPDGLTIQSLYSNDSFMRGIDSNERELISVYNNNYDFTSTLDDNCCTDSHSQEKEEPDQVEKQQNCKPCEVGYSKLQPFTFNQSFSSDDQQRLVPRRLSPSHSMPSVFNPPAISTPRHSRPTSANSRRYQELSQTVKKKSSNGSDSTLYHLNCTEFLELNSVSEEIQATVDHGQDHDKELLGTSNSQECHPNSGNVELSDYETQVVSNVSKKLYGIIEKMNQLAEKDCLSQKTISDLECEIVSLREEINQQKCELNHTINEQ